MLKCHKHKKYLKFYLNNEIEIESKALNFKCNLNININAIEK